VFPTQCDLPRGFGGDQRRRIHCLALVFASMYHDTFLGTGVHMFVSRFIPWHSCSYLCVTIHSLALVFASLFHDSFLGTRVRIFVSRFIPWHSCSHLCITIHSLGLVFASLCHDSFLGIRVRIFVSRFILWHSCSHLCTTITCRLCIRIPEVPTCLEPNTPPAGRTDISTSRRRHSSGNLVQ
jgi:hypothetical protein